MSLTFTRTLSAVAEDPLEDQVGSFTMKQNHGLPLRSFQPSPQQTPPQVVAQGSFEEDQLEGPDDDQDGFLFETNFGDYQDQQHPGSFQQRAPMRSQPPENVPTSAKCSMSTAKSSGGAGMPGGHFSDRFGIGAGNTSSSPGHYDSDFDMTLSKAQGDVSVIMRVSDDEGLHGKIMVLCKTIADKINTSLLQVK